MNRSIQAEGSFADTKEDMSFRRYLCRGERNVLAESTLVAIAHNINTNFTTKYNPEKPDSICLN